MFKRQYWLLGLIVLAASCSQGPDPKQRSLEFLAQWFNQAASGAREDSLCHGLGLLKHPQFSCVEMLEFAARGDQGSRVVTGFSTDDCMQDVCGQFYQVSFSGADTAGNELNENIILKEDEGTLRVYLYRSNLMFSNMPTEESEEEDKDPEQIAYDALTAQFPELYEYTPCYGVRPSSSNLRGELFAIEDADVKAINALAQDCGEKFCFALVGQKIATLCPNK